MEAGRASSDNMLAMDPQTFVTNLINKMKYRDALLTWADIIRTVVKADAKTNARLDTMGLIVYLACVEEAK